MDFGDILDEWERMTATPQGSKKQLKKQAEKDKAAASQTSAGQAVPKPDEPHLKKVDPLTAWLRIHGVYDKDADAEAIATHETGADASKRRRRLLQKEPDAVIDLHGLTQAEAWNALDSFFGNGRRQGFEKLCIVHGKGNHSDGNAVLKQLTRRFIEHCPFAGESGPANAASGGSGVTWVILKRGRSC
ncbi:MAG: Smr/MutS family protein [Treponema sp.]|jgi:DNA-nicking Smr family endonuclease|nr:Smr/MutS family protein [Treponema sp.]